MPLPMHLPRGQWRKDTQLYESQIAERHVQRLVIQRAHQVSLQGNESDKQPEECLATDQNHHMVHNHDGLPVTS